MHRFAALVALGIVLGRPSSAAAACAFRLSTCIDADTFFPHAGPAYFSLVGGTTTTPVGTVGIGWATTYLARPIVLVVPTTDPRGAETAAVNRLVDATFLFSYGLHPRIEATLAVPTTLYRTGTGISSLTSQHAEEIRGAALRDVRIGATFALLPVSRGSASDSAGRSDAAGQPEAAARPGEWAGPRSQEDGFGLATRFEIAFPTGDTTSFSGDRSAIGLPSVAADWRRGRFTFGSEFGARLRMISDLAGARVGTQLVFSLGAAGQIFDHHALDLLIEAIAIPTLAAQHEISPVDAARGRTVEGDRRPLVPAEWLVSVRTAALMSGDLTANLGAGSALPLTGESGITTPSVRAVLTLRYTPRVTPSP